MRLWTLTGVLLVILIGPPVHAADVQFNTFGEEYSRVFAHQNGGATFQPMHCPNPMSCDQDLGAGIMLTMEMASRSNVIETVTLVAPADERRASFRFFAAMNALIALLSPALNEQDRSALLQIMGSDFDKTGKARATRDSNLYELMSVPDQQIRFRATLKPH